MLIPWRVFLGGDLLPLKKRHFSQVPGTCECEAGWGGPVSWHPQPGKKGAPEKEKPA